jgi:hypothetical protein
MAKQTCTYSILYFAFCILVAVIATSARGTEHPWRIGQNDLVPDVLTSAGWRLLFREGATPTRFRARGEGGIAIETEDSVAFLYREILGQERRASRLVWRWKVIVNLPPADLTVVGSDDRPAAVHLWFDRPASGLSLWNRVRDGFAAIAGFPVAGHTLTYVWGGTHERGERFPSPYDKENGAVVVLRPGNTPLRQWHWEDVDFVTDFELAFGYPAPSVRYVAVSADSDDAGGSSSALVADLRFLGGPS